MKTTDITPEKIEGIYDIFSLTPPPFSTIEIFLMLLAAILFLSLVSVFFWNLFYSRKGVALREVKKLHILYTAKKINAHDAVYQLCFLLQQGLNLKQIHSNTPIPEKIEPKKASWDKFTQHLAALRYNRKSAADTESEAAVETVFKDSLVWLRLWP
jgi:hypothetical protein